MPPFMPVLAGPTGYLDLPRVKTLAIFHEQASNSHGAYLLHRLHLAPVCLREADPLLVRLLQVFRTRSTPPFVSGLRSPGSSCVYSCLPVIIRARR